ncbi:M28 family peptidase [Allomuricauda sp. d1]|uniref:M28 family metallopeptidase n=1 Tax=Allomuricauda sp. d1 TaxID=3136725 RepID=UPI0031DF0E4D
MQKFISLILVSLALACGSTKMVQTSDVIPSPPPAPSGPDGLKADTEKIASIGFTDAKTIGEHMNYLASDELKGRDTGSEGIEMAAAYIEKLFENNGVEPYYESYHDTLSNYKKPAYNVVGFVGGNDAQLKDEYILIGAHYDHIGVVKPENGDYIANGANDNASGTSTVLELARYFGTNKSNKRSLIFALFSAEEKGLYGSKHLAKKLHEADLNLYTMLNFEMTGVPLRVKDHFLYITGYGKSNLAEICNNYANEKLIGRSLIAKQYNLFQRSDNYPFYKEFGVPSHTYCAFDFTNFDYYHKPGDEVSEMDFEHMAKVVNKMIPVLEGIANAPNQEIKMN